MNIYDIAKLANVSIATVSRVVNNSPKVSPKTKEKVLAVMKENEYTPNAFARGLGLPTDIHGALEQILAPTHYTAMNVGVLDYENKHRRFAVSTGIGFDAAVCHQVMVTPLKAFLNRLKLGKLTYLGVALHKLFTLKPVTMTVTTENGETKTYEKVYFTAVMNLKYEGGGFNFCPAASGTDDRLDIITVAELPRLKVLCLLPTAFKGWHTRFHGIHLRIQLQK